MHHLWLHRKSTAADRVDSVVHAIMARLRGPGQRHLLPDFKDFLPAAKRDWYSSILRCVHPIPCSAWEPGMRLPMFTICYDPVRRYQVII